MWEININDQMLTFLYSLLLGGIFCIFYDVIRALRKVGLNSFLFVFVTDLIFWLFSAFSLFLFLLSRTNGELRGYVFFSCLLGFLLYRLILSRPTLFVFIKIFSGAAFVVRKLSRGIERFCRVIEAFLDFLGVFFGKKLKCIKKVLKSKGRMLYTKENKLDTEQTLNEF